MSRSKLSWVARRLAFVVLSGCLIGGGTRVVTALELRASVAGVNLTSLDGRLRTAVELGQIWPGATETELFLSRGTPHLWWNTRLGPNACRVFVHHTQDPSLADLAVTTCGGRVIGTNQIDPALPCWRLAEVGPRIVAAANYFEGRPLDVQWQIVIGLMHRGQAEQDVMIGFGEPHNRGFNEREDGKRAEELVFLDRSGDAYGLHVTLIDNRVVGWQMPAERVLTPEAQQRRLEAMEKRLTERIAQVEALAIRQHQETVRLFNQVNAKQDAMMEKLTRRPSVIVVGGGGGGAPPPPPPSGDGGPTSSNVPPPTDSTAPPPVQERPALPEAKVCSCEEIPCNDYFGSIKVNSCKARCIGDTEPACDCSGKCNKMKSGNTESITATQHKCGCT